MSKYINILHTVPLSTFIYLICKCQVEYAQVFVVYILTVYTIKSLYISWERNGGIERRSALKNMQTDVLMGVASICYMYSVGAMDIISTVFFCICYIAFTAFVYDRRVGHYGTLPEYDRIDYTMMFFYCMGLAHIGLRNVSVTKS